MESKTWKEIQQKTFTRWISQRLKGGTVNDLSTDLADGVLLYALMGELSQKDLGKYNPKPRIQVQKMENLQKVLNFIENEERIRLVNIGAGDIHDGNLKLILGLVWALILHYQISSIDLQEAGNTGNISGKQMLLHYIQDKIPHKDIKNFTSNWSDGTALASLVDAHAPGLCPEADTMDPNNALENTTLAMNMAEEWLGIPQVLSPEDMISMHVDELSVMTYLSQYPKVVVKPDAPISNRNSETSPLKKIMEQEFQIVDASLVESEIPVPIDGTKVKIYGPGITGNGVEIGKPAMVSIDCTGSGVVPSAVTLQNSDGVTENIEFQQSSLNAEIFDSVYVPNKVGKYMVTVKYDGSNLESKSFAVDITDQSQVIVSGSGITGDGANVDKPASIIVDCSKSGIGEVVAIIETSYSKGTKELKFLPQENGSSILESWYIPTKEGLHTVTVLFNGQSISNDPYLVNIVNIDKLKVTGSGVTGRGVRINESAQIILDCSDSGITPVAAKVKYPSGTTQDVSFRLSNDSPDIYVASYIPTITGVYEVAIEFNVKHIPINPIKVSINDITKVKVSGSGVTGEGARVGKPAEVIVDCSDSGIAPVTVKVTDPSGNTKEIPLRPTEEDPNIFEGSYAPTGAGDHEVAINFDSRPLPKSPIKVPIRDASKVKVSGPGVTREGANVGEPAEIIVDCSESGVAPVTTKVTTPTGETKDVEFKPKSPGSKIYTGSYTPSDIGEHSVEVDFDGEPVANSPYTANIKDINKVKVSGSGVTGENAQVGKPAEVIVDCSDSGVAPVAMKIMSPSGETKDVTLEPSEDNPNVFVGHYDPVDAGQYEVAVDFDNKPIPSSPIKVSINDITKVKVSGSGVTGEGARVGKPAEVIVDCSDSGIAPVAVKVTDPSGNTEEIPLCPKSNNPKIFEGVYTPKDAGNYETEVRFDDEPLPDSPYKLAIGKPECVRISGDGLDKAFVGEDNIIDVFTDDAGPGDVSVKFIGPPKAGPVVENVVKVDDNHYQVHFSPQDAGVYDFLLCVDSFELLDKHQSIPVIDLDKVIVTGPFIDSIVKTTTQTETFLNIETSASGLSVNDLSITIIDDDNNQVPYEIQELSEGFHKLLFTPLSTGNHTVSITFAERQIKDSPCVTKIEDFTLHSTARIGEGLFHTIINCKGEFDVCNVDELSVTVSITGPGDAVWNIEDVIDGMARVSYVASLPGSYKITVMSPHGTEVIGSPFVVDVVPDSVTKVQTKPVDPQYSIAAPLHIVAMIIMVGVMDHTFL